MTSTKDRISRSLIGFEQGVSVKTIEQLRSQTRARFSPLGNPTISFSLKKDQKASALIKITSIPKDPGTGKYNLAVTSSNGKVLKIRAADSLASTGTITVNDYSGASSFWNSGGFVISPFGGPDVKFEIDNSRVTPLYDSSNNEGGFGSPIAPNLVSSGNVYSITTKGSTDNIFTSIGAPENKVGVIFKATGAGSASPGVAANTLASRIAGRMAFLAIVGQGDGLTLLGSARIGGPGGRDFDS